MDIYGDILMVRASDIFTKEEIKKIKEITKLFNGKVVDICLDTRQGFKRIKQPE